MRKILPGIYEATPPFKEIIKNFDGCEYGVIFTTCASSLFTIPHGPFEKYKVQAGFLMFAMSFAYVSVVSAGKLTGFVPNTSYELSKPLKKQRQSYDFQIKACKELIEEHKDILRRKMGTKN